MTAVRNLASALANHAAQVLSVHRPMWAEAMRHEVDSLEDDGAALRWAAGCVVASYAERINPMRAASLWPMLGVFALFIFVFGAYVLGHGAIDVIFEAVPLELMIILGGAWAASTILTTIGGPGIFRSLGLSLRGRRFRTEDYRGLVTVLSDVLNGKASALTGRAYPVLYNADVAQLVGDARALAEPREIGAEQLGTILQSRIDSLLDDQSRAVRVLRAFGQCLLWFGVVAFVLGVIKAAASVTEPPEVMGGMLAHASVGPLLGVFLTAGIVYPLARRLEAAIADDSHLYRIVRTAFLTRAVGSSAEVAVRTAYGSLPPDFGMDREDSAAEPEQPTQKVITMKWALVIVAVVALVGATFVLDLTSADDRATAVSTPVIFQFQTMTVNTTTPGHYLKLGVMLDLSSEQDVGAIIELEPRIIDSFQEYLRGLSREDLEGQAGAAKVRAELLKRVNDQIKPVQVKNVLVKEMLVTDKP